LSVLSLATVETPCLFSLSTVETPCLCLV
jgi:hypothetical protein